MNIGLHTPIGVIAGLISMAAYLPYAYEIVRGRSRPNRATWIIWSIVCGLLFASYNAAAGGASRWVPLSDALGPTLIAALAIWCGEGALSSLDLWCLTVAGVSAVGWALTGSPMVSLSVNLILDFLGAIPTFRNEVWHPRSEPALVWRTFLLSNVLNVVAIEQWCWRSAAYPVYAVLVSGFVCALIHLPALRRVIRLMWFRNGRFLGSTLAGRRQDRFEARVLSERF